MKTPSVSHQPRSCASLASWTRLSCRSPSTPYSRRIWATTLGSGIERPYEFRRRFLEGRATRWFVYLNAPVSRLGAVIDLGPAVVDTPQRIAAIAEQTRDGNGASVLEYVQDLERAFAIPILHVSEYPGLSADELRDELGRFHPPQGYVRLNQHPQMLRLCEKLAADAPIRQMTVHHR